MGGDVSTLNFQVTVKGTVKTTLSGQLTQPWTHERVKFQEHHEQETVMQRHCVLFAMEKDCLILSVMALPFINGELCISPVIILLLIYFYHHESDQSFQFLLIN